MAKRAFLKAWVRAPLKMGAIVPSSNRLAQCMADQVDVAADGWVIELGAGTGAMTKALLHAGVKPEKLLVIERERRLYELLKTRWPHLHIVRADAAHLDKALAEHGVQHVSAIVSSLPLLSLPPGVQKLIVAQLISLLEKGGKLIQFTYGLHSPLPHRILQEKQIETRRVNRVWMNIPPAAVWYYQRGRMIHPNRNPDQSLKDYSTAISTSLRRFHGKVNGSS